MKQKIVIFGITGSIGQQAWELIKNKSNFELVGFSYHNNHELANKINKDSNSSYIWCSSDNKKGNVINYQELLNITNPDFVINSISGFSGLKVTQYCLENKIKLALANKESMVVAGHLINPKNIIPIDSELSAIYALICKNKNIYPQTIYLTASGGPFYHKTNNQLKSITYHEAIKHPNYKMGAKISIDSATLINKCFEMIEAHYLFKCNDVRPLFHPSSIVHGLVVDKNNAIYSYMSTPDMRLAINLALNNFIPNSPVISPLDLNKLTLYFETIDENKWLPIKWAQELIKNKLFAIGLIITIVDDYLINLFIKGKISFLEITSTINSYIKAYKNYSVKTWNEIYELKKLILLNLNKQFS